MALVVKNPTTDAGDWRDVGSVLGLGWSPGGGHSNPLQCSCLENPMDRGAWWLQSIGLHQIGHDWSDLAHTQATNCCFFKTKIRKLKSFLNSNLEMYALLSLKSTYIYIFLCIYLMSLNCSFQNEEKGGNYLSAHLQPNLDSYLLAMLLQFST